MNSLGRDNIHVSTYSNLSTEDAERLLNERVYNQKDAWQGFLKIFVLGLGLLLTLSGIIFFFAYNWANLHKFVKIGIPIFLLIATTLLALCAPLQLLTRKILLTASSVLVGVIFAVFGQVYQTGANAYDFFLAWTIGISLWVILTNFAALWAIWIVLLNVSFVFYAQQVAADWSFQFIINSLLIFNTALLCLASIPKGILRKIDSSTWLIYALSILCVGIGTISFIYSIISQEAQQNGVTFILVSILYAGGLYYAYEKRNTLLIALIPFSIILIISALIFKILDNELSFFVVSIFCIASVTLLIRELVNLKKKQNALSNDKQTSPPLTVDVDATAESFVELPAEQSIATKILSIFGGVFATVTFLGFLFITGIYDSPQALLILGIISVIVSLGIYKMSKNIIYDTFTVTTFITGLSFIGIALNQLHFGDNNLIVLYIAIGALLFCLVEHYILLFISLLISISAIYILLLSNHIEMFTPIYVAFIALLLTLVFFQEAALITHSPWLSKRYYALRIGLLVSLLMGLSAVNTFDLDSLDWYYIWIGRALFSAVLLGVCVKLAPRITFVNDKHKVGIYAIGFLLIILSSVSTGLSGSILIILLSFMVNYRIGFVLGILNFLYFLFSYYYSLEFSLLLKSMLLIVPGLLLLGCYFPFTKKSDDELI